MKKVNPVFLAVVIALWLPAVLLCSALFGCAPGSHPPFAPIADQHYTTLTNTVQTISQVGGAAAPAPFGTAIQGASAAVLALLAAWQAVTSKKLETLSAKTDRPETIDTK
jgi:hypothetical protein